MAIILMKNSMAFFSLSLSPSHSLPSTPFLAYRRCFGLCVCVSFAFGSNHSHLVHRYDEQRDRVATTCENYPSRFNIVNSLNRLEML